MSAIEISETDLGTKQKTRRAIKRIQRKHKQMKRHMMTVVNKIVQDAKRLCPKDTGMLSHSIRAVEIKGEVPESTYFTKEAYAGWDWHVLAGGPPYVNPKTRRIVDYAQAVHDGTSTRPPTPFLTDALELNRNALMEALEKHADDIAKEWVSD